jgi:hypothetical protein
VANSSKKIDYSARLKAIRPFVNFNYDLRHELSSAAKHKINRYFDYIEKLSIRPHQIYRTRDAKRLKAVQLYSGHDTKHPGLTVAFVPNASSEKMRIRVSKKGEVTGSTSHITTHNIRFDLGKLAKLAREDELDPTKNYVKEYLQRLIDNGPVVKRYSIMAGEFETPSTYLKGNIANEVMIRMHRYSAEVTDATDTSSHYFGNWMFGLNGYNFLNQKSLDDYRETKHKMQKVAARGKVNQRRREQQAREANRTRFFLSDQSAVARKAKTAPSAGEWREVPEREYYEAVFKNGYSEKGARK